jgi:hypothetical protein
MELKRKAKILPTTVVSEKLSEPIKITWQQMDKKNDCLAWNVTLLSRCFSSLMPIFGAAIKLQKTLNIESSMVFTVRDDIEF